jgi:L-ribulose-5-phosphate 3-epimerase
VTGVGIMQGRLTPPAGDRIQQFPVAAWEEEFPVAASAGFAAIEWIYDTASEGANPIETDAGIARLGELAERHGVRVQSLCADWFMEQPLGGGDDGVERGWLERLEWLLGRCPSSGIRHIVLPFVDDAAIVSENDRQVVALALREGAAYARQHGVELHVESSLPPEELRALIEAVDAPEVRINYDTGNSASLGYDTTEELAVYGDLIGSVHVKDRLRGGGTVPLGEGDADIPRTFAALRARGYAGSLILQVARGLRGDEAAWAARNRELVERLWEAAG